MSPTTCWILVLFAVTVAVGAALAQNQNQTGSSEEEEEEPSFVGLFGGLLETLTETATASDCRGQCLHTLRALMCDAIDDHASCPGSLRCCVERHVVEGLRPPFHSPPPQQQHPQHPQHPHFQPPFQGPPLSPQQQQHFQRPPPPPQQQTPTTTPPPPPPPASSTTTTQPPTKKPPHPTPEKPAHIVLPSPPKKQQEIRPCPGVCVTPRMSQYCDQILPAHRCEQGLSCCVQAEADAPGEDDELEEEASMVTTTSTQPTLHQARPTQTRLAPCPGHCTSPLLTFFGCTEARGAYHCPGGGVCCSAPPPPPAGGKPCLRLCVHSSLECGERVEGECREGWRCCKEPPPPPRPQAQRVATTTTAEPEPELVEELPPCPGTCIQHLLAFTCFRNAELSELFSCPKQGAVCCAPKTALKEEPANGTVSMEEVQQVIERRPAAPVPAPVQLQVHQEPLIVQQQQNYVCGVKNQQRTARIVGGSDASPGEWCWQVALINSLNQYLCGGALIGSGWVLTAAHCVTNLLRSGSPLYVRLGDHDLTSQQGSPAAQTLRVATTYIHHNHNSQTLDNDIALLKLQSQANLSRSVCLVCLPSRGSSLLPGRRCTVTGYGYMGEAGPIPLRVRGVQLPVVGEGECVEKVNAVTEKQFVLPASSFCAGGERGSDACQGDGGGPFVCLNEGYYELTGLVSWGFGCGREAVPGVYVKVGAFVGWVNQIISVNN